MRVSMLTPYYPPADGGIAVFVKELSDELHTMKHDVQILSREGPDGFNIPGPKSDFIEHSINSLNEFKPNAIHAHSDWFTLKAALDYRKKYDKEVRIIFTFHTGLVKPLSGLKKMAFESMLAKANNITFVSSALRDEVSKHYKLTSNTQTIHPGVRYVEPEKMKVDEFRKKYSITPDDIVITFIGPLEWERKVEGVKLLIQTFKKLNDKNAQTRLLIVGDGTHRKNLETLIEQLGLSKKATITGFVSDVSIPFGASSVYAHISLQEGLPLALLEAMSHGLAIVASRTGGIPEVITDGENGILVEPDDTKIFDSLMRVSNIHLREFLGKNAKKDSEKLTWNRTAGEFIKLYGEQ